MSMNKVIHGAVRPDLGRFLDALEAFRDGDPACADQLATASDPSYASSPTHHQGEHQVVWPVLESLEVDRTVLAQMDAEHDRLAEALAAVRRHVPQSGRGHPDHRLRRRRYRRDVASVWAQP
jgi:hypothetical protein